MLLLARPYEDEPIASALVRGCRHFGVALKQVFSHGGESSTKGGRSMPFLGIAPLSFFAQLFDMDAESLLSGHTVLPYATAFSERNVWDRAIANSLAAESDPKTMGAVIQCAIHGLPQRRFCRTCVAEDIQTHGESYWRRSHQLPGSLVCHVHGEVLRSTNLRIAGASSSYDLPQHCSGPACIAGAVPEGWQRVAKRITELSARGLEAPIARPDSYYRDLAVERGWLRPNRSVNSERLASLITDRFGKALLAACGIARSGSLGWASLMLHERPSVPFSTLKHILMEELLAGYAVDLSHKPHGPSARSRTEEDKAYAAAVRRVAAGFVSRGRRVRMADVLKQAGCWGAYRHAKENALPRLSRVVKELQTSELAQRPHALQMLAVPHGNGDMMTRQDLIKAGHLLCSKDAARRLGVHWYRMKPMQRDGRIFSIRYANRDWYPAFWCSEGADQTGLVRVLRASQGMSKEAQWDALIETLAPRSGTA